MSTELNLNDPAVQKRLAAQWGYVPAALGGVPQGWKLVPVEPTRGQIMAALVSNSVDWAGQTNIPQSIYRAMLSAAPAPEVGGVLVGFMSPKQLPKIVDPEGLFGAYIPMRKTAAGNFTLALYAAPSAAPAQDAPAIAAKPLEWDQDYGFQWTDKHHGFSIIEEPGDDKPFSAAWGEGDADQFATLDEAKAWCQAQIDAYFSKHARIAGAQA